MRCAACKSIISMVDIESGLCDECYKVATKVKFNLGNLYAKLSKTGGCHETDKLLLLKDYLVAVQENPAKIIDRMFPPGERLFSKSILEPVKPWFDGHGYTK